jgi:hypothetical protein
MHAIFRGLLAGVAMQCCVLCVAALAVLGIPLGVGMIFSLTVAAALVGVAGALLGLHDRRSITQAVDRWAVAAGVLSVLAASAMIGGLFVTTEMLLFVTL